MRYLLALLLLFTVYVQDCNGKPLAGVEVEADYGDYGYVFKTDKQGTVSFTPAEDEFRVGVFGIYQTVQSESQSLTFRYCRLAFPVVVK